jgi:hypothetical protein
MFLVLRYVFLIAGLFVFFLLQLLMCEKENRKKEENANDKNIYLYKTDIKSTLLYRPSSGDKSVLLIFIGLFENGFSSKDVLIENYLGGYWLVYSVHVIFISFPKKVTMKLN